MFKFKWKLSKNSEKIIDLHAYNEYAFQCACQSGNLDLVKYLWIISNSTINLLFLKQENIHSNVKDFINSIKKN